MNEDKKICPFMVDVYTHYDHHEPQGIVSHRVPCIEGKCMAWGVVGDANEFKWTCKLIEGKND